MKHIFRFFIIGLLSVGLFSCELPDNLDPKAPTEVQAQSLFMNAQINLVDYISSINQNLNNSRLLAQYAAQTTYTDESRYNFLDRQFNDALWDRLYHNVLRDLEEARTKLEGEAEAYSTAEYANCIAAIEILEVYTYQVLVDQFGNVPYSEALQGQDNPTPVYDDAQAIYEDLVSRLDAAISSITPSAGSWGSYDQFFSGSGQSWHYFANSLKLRIAMRAADVTSGWTDGNPQAWAEEAVTSGVFPDQGASAKLHYPGTDPNIYTIYEEMVQGGRKDFVPANTIVDLMAQNKDPRIHYYFDPLNFDFPVDEDTGDPINDTIIVDYPMLFTFNNGEDSLFSPDPALGDTAFVVTADLESLSPQYYPGGPYGDGNVYGSTASYFDAQLNQPDFAFTVIDYVEVEFLLAEAVERGYAVGGTAEDHYNNAIEASIIDWGGTAAEATTYLGLADVAYATAPGDWRQKIGTQKYIALFERGVEAWAEWRKFDYPEFNPPPGMTYADIPVRQPYPFNEDNLNQENYEAAAAAIGGDLVSTRLFWDTTDSPFLTK